MTVGELIEKLQNYHDNTVVVSPTGDGGYWDITGIYEKRIKLYDNIRSPHEADENMGVPCVVIS